MIPGLGSVRVRRLLEAFGSARAVLEARRGDLRDVPGIPAAVADAVVDWQQHVDLGSELDRVASFGAQIVTLSDPEYPPLLATIHDPPVALYVWGEIRQEDFQSVSVVGSRRTTTYGLECAKKLSYQLAYAGMTIISGLARGIDTAAHQGAIAAKGRTIGVLGGGLMRFFPQENYALAERMAENGAVISEFPMTMEPDKGTFPRRNRIVSGWSHSLLVIEAGLKSGALITANQASDQNRTVFAVPGPIDRPTCAGSNRLIQQGAKLVMSAADILEEQDLLFPTRPEPLQSAPDRLLQLSDTERAVYNAISDSETSVETIADNSKLQPGILSSTLLALEMKRLVKRLPGQYFVKLL